MWLLVGWLGTACSGNEEAAKEELSEAEADPSLSSDDDGDGFSEVDGDCDDVDPLTFPGSAEHEAVFGCMTDADGDGWGSKIPAPGIAAGTDCDDNDASQNHNDDDGDGNTSCDGDCDDNDSIMNLHDVDEDGHTPCDGDCDDNDRFTHPGAAEYEGGDLCTTDADDDGWGTATPTTSGATAGTDCDDSDSRLNNSDTDQDGVSSCDGDCDDNSGAIHTFDNDGDGESPCEGDCNDNDASLNRKDEDGDGFTSCYSDCNDLDANTYPEAPELCDGTYNDCSAVGYAQYGAPANERDDDADGSVECLDDGTPWAGSEPILGYADCDDTSPYYNENDVDGDGFSTCNDDCDDDDAFTFPGAGYEESATDCMTDVDGDGFGDILKCCYNLYMIDSWGDGWNGAYLTAYEDGIAISTHSVSEASGTTESAEVCVQNGASMMLMYTSGSNETENSYILYDPDDGIVFEDGPEPQYGAAYAENLFWNDYVTCTFNAGVVSGTDCNDADSTINTTSSEVYGDSLDNNCNGITDGQASVRFAQTEYTGESSGEKLGKVISRAGDVDGDGLADILLSSATNDQQDTDAGKVYIIFGASLSEAILPVDNADVQLLGEAANDQAGASISSAGDVDGDEQSDVLIGAQYNDDNGNAAGKAYLFLGASLTPGTLSLGDADYTFLGENAVDLAGSHVATAGDVDDDGYDDILIGARYYDGSYNRAGQTYLFLGSNLIIGPQSLSTADHVFTGEASQDYAAMAVPAGDVDGDGLDDIFLSSATNDDGGEDAGKSYLIYGTSLNSATLSLSNADVSFIGETTMDYAGSTIKGIGDINNDGLDDLAIGAYAYDHNGNSDVGKVYIVTNSAMLSSSIQLVNAAYHIYGEAANDWAGHAITSIGDLDGDGGSELVISAPQNDEAHSNAGKIYMFYNTSIAPGSLYLADADVSYTGNDSNNNAGYGLENVGDVNNDGNQDLLIGAYGNNSNGPNTGKVYLFTNALD